MNLAPISTALQARTSSFDAGIDAERMSLRQFAPLSHASVAGRSATVPRRQSSAECRTDKLRAAGPRLQSAGADERSSRAGDFPRRPL